MLLLTLVACPADPDSKAPPGGANFIDPDGATLAVDTDAVLVWSGVDGVDRLVHLRFGDVPGADDTDNYDPWNLYDDSYDAVPAGLSWVTPVAATADGDVLTLELDNGDVATLTVDSAGPGLRLGLHHDDSEDWYPYLAVAIEIADDEELYGTGERFESVLQRGHVQAMQFEAELDRESGYNETHVPVPLVVSSAGWGLLVDSYWPGAFDLAAVETDRVTAVFNQKDGIDIDLYAPGSPREAIARYNQRSGPSEIPPTWAFAPLQWRNEVAGSEDVRADAAAIRENGIPTGVIWVDNPWQTTYNSMVPDTTMFPDWDALVDELHAAGFRMMAWTTPYVEDADPEHQAYLDNGYLITGQLLFSDFGDIVDLTLPAAADAWADRATTAYGRGIEGWKLDYGEDVQVGFANLAVQWTFANGEDERTMHHQYAMYYHEPYTVGPDGDGMLLGRGGCLRGQTVTDVIWPGDLDSDFEKWDDDCYGDGLCVGGLPAAIRGGTSLAASGYPYFASDTGGFRHDRPTKEAFLRWSEYSATLPIMQYGGGGDNHNPWDFTDYGASHFDAETLAIFKQMAQLHIRLFPYFWMLSERHLETGLPIVMAQGVAWPEAGVHTDNSYAVGDDLFVAPVEEAGVTTRALTIPPGSWVHWWTGERYEEGAQTVDAPLGVSPLFLRVGAAVPMLRRSVVTLSPADEGVDSWAEDPGALNVRVVPGDGGFTLSTGEALVNGSSSITLTGGSLYTGWDLEIWAPGVTSASVDGVALAAGSEGCTNCTFSDGTWLRVVVDGGSTVTF